MSKYFSASTSAGKNATLVPESPAPKRQKTSGGYNAQGYDSDIDDGDALFDDIETTPQGHVTQPTQIIDNPQFPLSSPTSKGEVQVPASSPFRSSPAKPSTEGGRLANLMAPAGTKFRPPMGRPAPAVIELDDDDEGPTFQGGSSDNETMNRGDIKPSTFSTSVKGSFTSNSSSSKDSFRSIVGGYEYNASRPKPDPLASAYGGQRKPQTQAKPDRAQPVQDINVAEEEPIMQGKIRRLRNIFPGITVLLAKNAVLSCNGSFDDAAAMLAQQRDAEADDDVVIISKPQTQSMKAGLSKPLASIQQRFGAPQSAKKVSPYLPQISQTSPVAQPKKRKLVQGRKTQEPPSPQTPVIAPPPKQESPEVEELSDRDSQDSGVGSEDELDPEVEDRVVKFLNKCKAEELVDLASISMDDAQALLDQRPFADGDAVRSVSIATKTKTGKRSTKAAFGEKTFNVAVDMWTGYEAVDALVSECESLGKPLAEAMSKWGVNVFGASKEGELEMTSFDDDDKDSNKDSGIGTPNSLQNDDEIKVPVSRKTNFLKKPSIMAENIVLKDYQLVGLNWLALLYKHKLSCILADEMGLGKTCQVISFLAHLADVGNSGPHLVIVPGSTLENWLREFKTFCPSLVVQPYYGPQAERAELAEKILGERHEINVVVSTYDMAFKAEDNKFMRRLRPDVCVYDEGHLLKNPSAQRYKSMMRIPAKFRLLLTGTPLQNNLMELAALLAFIMPQVFEKKQDELAVIFKHKAKTSDTDHAALLSQQRIARARSMLTPFVLRRKKQQVLKHMPPKTCRVEYCTLHPAQAKVYNGHILKAQERAKLLESGQRVPKTDENNPLMQLRKAAIHPLLFRRHFSDEKIQRMADVLRKHEPDNFPPSYARDKLVREMSMMSDFILHTWCNLYPCISKFDIRDGAWMDSGKVDALVKLLKSYEENGDRVLIFSQFSLVLDILETVLNTIAMKFTRIDGSTNINERQTLIDNYRDDESITAFLLTTKAGGTGINLMYANKVVIFDGSFNPQDDVQAENRAHRVGQVREVEVVRLVTKGTIEEAIYKLGMSKLELDTKVAGDEEERGEKAVAKMLIEGGLEKVEVGEEAEDIASRDDEDVKEPKPKKKLVRLRMGRKRADSED